MDFELDESHQALVRKARDFARDVLAPGARQRAIEGTFSHDLWLRSGQVGLTGLAAEEKWGGQGHDTLTTTLIVEAVAEECEDLGFLLSLCGHNFGCVVPVALAGSEVLKSQWLASLASGATIGAGALTEADAGSDAFALSARAMETDGGFTINGRKLYVTNAPIADVFVIYARTEPEPGAFGISAFLVPKTAPGLSLEAAPPKSGLKSAPWATVRLQDCHVPTTALLGKRGAGAAIFQEAMRWERICLIGMSLGATARMLARCVERVCTRKQFGVAIGQFQAVSDKVVGMRIGLEASKLLLYRAAWMYDHGKPADEAIAIGKIVASENAVAAGIDAVQLFGAEGIMPDHGVDLFLRDMLPLRILSGTSEVQRQIIARLMGITHDATRRAVGAGKSIS